MGQAAARKHRAAVDHAEFVGADQALHDHAFVCVVGNGGGITGWNAAGTALFKDNFLQPSELMELGTKYALMQSKVFLNFAVFDQKRTFKSTSSTIIQRFHSKGFEAELNYQPNKHLYGTLSYSFLDAKTSAGFQSDGGVGQFFAAAPPDATPRWAPGDASARPIEIIDGGEVVKDLIG